MFQYTRPSLVLLAALVVPSAGCALPMVLPVAVPRGEIETETGITFAEAGGEALKLDMARPKNSKGPWPAVVCIHGGGWVSGSRVSMRPWAEYLAAYGYVAVTVSYRLAPKHPFPAAVADVRNCVRWLRRHAKEYNIDPYHIGVMGLSAGGHLSLMLGLASDDDRFGREDEVESGESARVQAVVNYFGPGDLVPRSWSDFAVRQYLVPFLGPDGKQRGEKARQASPLSYISKDDPPVLTFQGDADSLVPPSQAYELHSRLSRAGLSNELQILHRQGHGWGEPYLSRTRLDMIRFFDRHLKGLITCPATATAPE
ncbi:MAG: alpha/beta hydrolase fold domain-containing protein [Phycisphaerae bacterium]